MNSFEQYFSKNYFQAREKFRKKTKDLKKSNKKIIDNLTIDTALHETKDKKKMLIIVSGTHGVEGYTGSAVQYFFMKKYFKKVKNKYSVFLIHALNPYGFKNNRRYNENNVDLNRNNLKNFFDANYHLEIKKEYLEQFFDAKKPLINEKIQKIKDYYHIFGLVDKYGIKETVKILSYGQNRFPKGICFAGLKKEKSIKFLDRKIKEVTKGYKEVIFLDVHTGTAKKNKLEIFVSNKKNTKKVKEIKKKFSINNKKYDVKGINHIGGTENSLFDNSLAKENIHLTLEYGTINRFSTLLSINYLSYLLYRENQVTQYGPLDKIRKIRKEMKKAYSPDTRIYKKEVIKKTDLFLKRLIVDQ